MGQMILIISHTSHIDVQVLHLPPDGYDAGGPPAA
jgi:hypothetical protein